MPGAAAGLAPRLPAAGSVRSTRRRADAGGSGAANRNRSAPPPPRHQHIRDTCITPQAIADLRTTVYGLVAFVFFFIDTPNRGTTIVRRFCFANGLPVLLDEDEDYDDAALCLVLFKARMNWMVLAVDADGYAAPAVLSADEKARALLALTAAVAAAGSGLQSAEASPQSRS